MVFNSGLGLSAEIKTYISSLHIIEHLRSLSKSSLPKINPTSLEPNDILLKNALTAAENEFYDTIYAMIGYDFYNVSRSRTWGKDEKSLLEDFPYIQARDPWNGTQ